MKRGFMRKRWIVIIVILLIVAALIGIRVFSKKAQTGSKTPGVDNNTHTVTFGDINSRIEITGELQPQTVVSQKSRVSGKVVKFYVDENDYVRKGDIIADIEPDYNQANTLFSTKATLQRAELNLRQAQKDFADKTLLLEKNYVSQADFDLSRDALLESEIQFTQASSQYEMIRDLDVPGTVIHMYATASGTVIERKINEGEMVTSSINAFGEGTVVMQIADLNKMIVSSNINEVDIVKFMVGQEATIKLDALPYEEFSGKIVKISPKAVVINSAKVFPVEISINSTGDKVKPGMTAAISILGDSRENVLIIPIGAVFADDKNQDIVYLIPKQSEDSAEKSETVQPVSTVIRLGANDFQMVEVISGLNENDVISLTEPGTNKTVFFGN
jgi:RND family efflux transporter MFP subunit